MPRSSMSEANGKRLDKGMRRDKGKRRDVVRSFVRSAASRAGRLLNDNLPVSNLVTTLNDLRHQRTRLDEARLSTAVASLPGVTSATVTARAGVLRVDALFDSGDEVFASLTPSKVRFAPRGAKEVSFLVQPDTQLRNPHLSDVVSALACEVASAVWGFGRRGGIALAPVDRDGVHIRVDLRGTPMARKLMGTPMEVVMDVFTLASWKAEDNALLIEARPIRA